MKRNLAFLLIMTSAALAQTPTAATKPPAKPSAVTVKAAPQPAAQPVKVNAAPVSKPATVSVQAVPAKTAASAPVKSGSVSSSQAKPVPTSAKASPPVVAVKPAPAPAKASVDAKAPPAKKTAEAKVPAKEMPKAVAVKVPTKEAAKSAVAKKPAQAQTTVAVQDSKAAEGDKKPASKVISAVGRRDPFVSPVVKLGTGGSGCSTGKRCLAIDQIALKGVVKADVGMIAVVVNAMNKAYFLRENDPVFNGYVVKITGDSIVFKETFHDRLGKPLTRDVTKTIIRPAV